MSGHGGPRHSIEPNPRHHSAGDPAVDRHVIEQELRDQSDAAERARRLRDYHMRSGRCLYVQSADALSLAVPRSSIAVTALPTKGNETWYYDGMTPVVSQRPLEDTDRAGGDSHSHTSRCTHSAACAIASAESPRQPSSITSSRTAATRSSSGIERTGNHSAPPVMVVRRPVKMVGSVIGAQLSIRHEAPISTLGDE
jgi:hypothetical protein